MKRCDVVNHGLGRVLISFAVTKLCVDDPSETILCKPTLYHCTVPHVLSHVNMSSLIDFVSNLRVPLGVRLRGSSPAISPGMASYHSMR